MYRNSFRLTNTEIDDAFAARHFRLVFQPKIRLSDGRLMGAESFARWQHPQFGVIPPALFLPVLARQGRSQELTRYVLGEAIAQLARWSIHDESLTISVNVAPEELADGSLPISIRLALNTADVDPSRLVLDLPERGLAAEPDRAKATIHALSEIGIGLALECAAEPLIDFKAADPQTLDPSSFGELKIGGQAIIQFASRLEGTGLGLMQSRIAYARDNAMTTTAVGAETPQTISLLPSLGFELAQGNAISPPLTPHALAGFTPDAHALTAPAPTPAKQPLEQLVLPQAPVPTAKPPRVRVVRGAAQIDLMTDQGTGTQARIARLRVPSPHDATAPAKTADDAASEGLLSKWHQRLSRALAF